MGQVGSLVNIGPSIGLEVGFDLDVSGTLNFTYGAKAQVRSQFNISSLRAQYLQVPSGSFASFNLVNSSGAWDPTFSAQGWSVLPSSDRCSYIHALLNVKGQRWYRPDPIPR